jgi:hypothetical protein
MKKPQNISRVALPIPSSVILSAAMTLLVHRPSAKAEGSIAYDFENYREEDGRVTVETQSTSLNQDVGTGGQISLSGTRFAASTSRRFFSSNASSRSLKCLRMRRPLSQPDN